MTENGKAGGNPRLNPGVPSLAGSDCDCGPLCGANGKPHGAAARHSSQIGSQSGLQGTRPAAAAALGISPAAELSLLGSQMHTSNRSACHPCSNRVSVTSRTAVYGPVRTVVWEGRSCKAPPYPDHWHFSDVTARADDVSSSGESRHCGCEYLRSDF